MALHVCWPENYIGILSRRGGINYMIKISPNFILLEGNLEKIFSEERMFLWQIVGLVFNMFCGSRKPMKNTQVLLLN